MVFKEVRFSLVSRGGQELKTSNRLQRIVRWLRVRVSPQPGMGDGTQCLETQKVFSLLNSHTAEECKRNMEVRVDIIT